MSLEEYKGVYVFAQQVDGEVSGIAYELLGKAKDLAKDLNTDVTAVLIGYNVKGLVDGLAQYGADKVIVVDDKGETTSVVGASIGGGNVRIDQINGVDVEFTGEYCTMIIKQQDTPGVVAYITSSLSEYNINIAFMRLYREDKGAFAFTIIETDEHIDERVQDKIREHASILSVRII